MHPVIRFVLHGAMLALAAGTMHAQTAATDTRNRNEVGLVIGATVTPSVTAERGGNITHDPSLALGADYDRRFVGRKFTIYAGIDFLASPLDVKNSSQPADVSQQYAYLFLTPHVRVKFNPDALFEPWLEFGGGYADFTPSQPRVGSVKIAGNGSKGALEFGGGVDTKPFLHLKGVPVLRNLPVGARIEVRDFYSGQPKYGVATTSSAQNNVAFTGGLLLRF